MAEESAVRSGLDWILDRFPAKETLARRLFLTVPAFHSACDDYRLARRGLASFEKLSSSAPRPEVEEYRVLVHELEAELLAMFAAADADATCLAAAGHHDQVRTVRPADPAAMAKRAQRSLNVYPEGSDRSE